VYSYSASENDPASESQSDNGSGVEQQAPKTAVAGQVGPAVTALSEEELKRALAASKAKELQKDAELAALRKLDLGQSLERAQARLASKDAEINRLQMAARARRIVADLPAPAPIPAHTAAASSRDQ